MVGVEMELGESLYYSYSYSADEVMVMDSEALAEMEELNLR